MIYLWDYAVTLSLLGMVSALSGVSEDVSPVKLQRELRSATSQDFEVVRPYIVEENGDINHDFSRNRRSTIGKSVIHVNVSGLGQKFKLELSENKKLLAPGFKVYRRKNSSNNTEEESVSPEDIENDLACLYTGHVKTHGNSPVAVNLCNGVKGIIRTAEEDYIIEPVEHHIVVGLDLDNSIGKPHKLYKRSSLGVGQFQFEASNSAFTKAFYHDEERRSKRRASKHRYLQKNADRTVETLVVVDKTMYHNHGDKNITTYTLTLFNMVSKLFQDTSIGNPINIVLVGLILLEGDEPGLVINHHADRTLNSFCAWQSVLVGANGRQHDHAILLTGMDLCSYKNAPCDTLGFAPIEGMCNRIRSCTINEDTGLATALTIAHEVGHNFGMFHDGEGNYCTQSAGSVMAPTLIGKDGLFQWSVCSRAYLMRFLNTPQSDCLDDKPKHVAELKFPDKLPGELYNADIQCKWQFGNRARLCTYDFGKDTCKALWCYRGNKRCETKFLPAAEGTSCGPGMWCRQGKCVKYGSNGPKPVNGGWKSWGQWSSCSRTCGKGVMSRERACTKPLSAPERQIEEGVTITTTIKTPQYGGKKCPGKEKETKICNVQKCPYGDEDFHAVQCSTYDQKPFRGWYLQWKPYKKLFDAREPCKLYCVAETFNYVFTIKHMGYDGTRCNKHGDLCVSGSCMSFGCDGIVGSVVKNDICGVCKGDNSTCKLIRGEYTQQPALNTYFPIAVLPNSARHVRIREKSISSNYLAIRNIYGRYYLNGDRRVAWPGVYKLGGANFNYKRPYNEPETLETDGPLGEDLIVEMLVQDRNPGIIYEYTIPKTEEELKPTTPQVKYTWSVSVSSCSEPCAGGEKTVSAICHKDLQEEVKPIFCDAAKKPKTGVFPCSEQPCPPRWVPETWQQCTKTCAGGKQIRKVTCRQKGPTKDRKIKRKLCKHLPKPAKKRRCNSHQCPPMWHVSKWVKCSVVCGKGTQRRRVLCRRREKRGYRMLPENMCNSRMKPNSTRVCQKRPCKEKYDWLLSPWGPCSTTCGQGVQVRNVKCVDSSGFPHLSGCKSRSKPTTSRPCDAGACPPKDAPSSPSFCKDKERWCYLVKQHKACNRRYYRRSCCETCRGS